MAETIGLILGYVIVGGITVGHVLGAVVLSTGLTLISQALLQPPDAGQPLSARSLSALRNLQRSNTAPQRKIYGTARTSGVLIYAQTVNELGLVADESKILHLVIVLARGPVNRITDIELNDREARNDEFANLIAFVPFTGSLDQQTIRSQIAILNSTLILPQEWTQKNRPLQGIAGLYCVMRYDIGAFPSGAPSIRATIEGSLLWDPRDSSQSAYDPSTWKWSNNWALCILDFLLDKDMGLGVKVVDIDIDSVIIAANISDEEVAMPIPPQNVASRAETQKRYTCDGVIESNTPKVEILQAMLSAGAGELIFINGKYILRAGAPTTPTFSIAEEDVLGEDTVITPSAGRSRTFNSVRGTFVNADKNYDGDSFPPIEFPDMIRNDGNERLWLDLDFPFTSDVIRAQRLAMIQLLRERYKTSFTMTTWPGKYNLTVGDTGGVNLSYLGWVNRQFKITDLSFSFDEGIKLVFKEYSNAIYDWDPTLAKYKDPVPDIKFPNPFVVHSVLRLTATEQVRIEPDGRHTAIIVVTFDKPEPISNVDYFLIEWRHENDDNTKTHQFRTLDGYYEIANVKAGSYAIAVTTIAKTGTKSSTAKLTVAVTFVSLPPPAPTRLAYARAAGGIHIFDWDIPDPAPPDILGYRIKWDNGHHNADPDAEWVEANTVSGSAVTIKNNQFATNKFFQVPGEYTVYVKTVDTTLQESEHAVGVTFTVPAFRNEGVIYTREESDYGWPGTLKDARIIGNMVVPIGDSSWADAPWTGPWSAIESWIQSGRKFRYKTLELDLGRNAFVNLEVEPFGSGEYDVLFRYRVDIDSPYSGWARPRGFYGRYFQVYVIGSSEEGAAVLKRLSITAIESRDTEIANDIDTTDLPGTAKIRRIEATLSRFREGRHWNTFVRPTSVSPDANLVADFETNLAVVSGAGSTSLNITTGLTIGAMIRPLDLAQNGKIFQRGTDYALSIVNDEVSLVKTGGSGTPTITITLPDAFGWHHIAFTYKSGVLKAFLDGALVGDPEIVELSFATTGTSFSIGESNYRGLIKNLAIKNTGVTDDDVADMAQGILDGTETDVVGYWKLNDNGSDIMDHSGYGNHGTVANEVGWVLEGTRYSPPMGLDVIYWLASLPVVSYLASVPVGAEVIIEESLDGETWYNLKTITNSEDSQIGNATSGLFAGQIGEPLNSLFYHLRVSLKGTTDAPRLKQLEAIFGSYNTPGNFVYVPVTQFHTIETAAISAIQTPGAHFWCVVAKYPYGIRFLVEDQDSSGVFESQGVVADIEISGVKSNERA